MSSASEDGGPSRSTDAGRTDEPLRLEAGIWAEAGLLRLGTGPRAWGCRLQGDGSVPYVWGGGPGLGPQGPGGARPGPYVGSWGWGLGG